MTDTQDINSSSRPSGRRRSDRIVGASGGLKESVDQATRAARLTTPVIVTGPDGSGRGHLARSIHAWSARASVPLVVFSATGTPEEQHLREIFGAASSSEPLAGGGYDGALAQAAEGTVLIEGVDRLVPAARSGLAHTIAQQSFARVEDATPIPLRCRILVTGQTGAEMGLGDSFEIVRLSPLADRVEDILPLAVHFLAEQADAGGSEPVGFTNDARRWLVEEPWPGNVKELRERIRQAVRLVGDGAISAEALMLGLEGDEVPSFKEAKRAFETRYVEVLLRRCGGNISRAARLAKKDRKDFYDVIRRTGVDPGNFRS
ncbi:MAG: sigma 54-interacting transcriptional regulator [Myxococcota bacterium]|nr:sigma 54-interacting transcriptional regulator [Myxococcota bacterium]